MTGPSTAPRTVWLPEDHPHGVGGLHRALWRRAASWSVPKGERGVVASWALPPVDSGDSAFLVQIAHACRPGTPVALLRLKAAAGEEVHEVKAEHVERGGWQRAAIRFRAAGESPLGLSLVSTGEAAIRLGSAAFWKRCGRPIYVIAHMSNSPEVVREDLADGANAVECDVGPHDGSVEGKLMAFHRFSPPYFRRSATKTELVELLRELEGSLGALALVILDCHELRDEPRDYRTLGRRLAEAVRDRLPAGRTLVSLEDASMAGTFAGLEDAGFGAGKDFSMATEDGDGAGGDWVEAAARHGITALGIGTDCFNPGSFLPTWRRKVAQAVNARDFGNGVAKVYYWTLGSKAAMRNMLDLAVDGLLVNRPRALREVLDEEPYRWLYRLATPADSQFEVHGGA